MQIISMFISTLHCVDTRYHRHLATLRSSPSSSASYTAISVSSASLSPSTASYLVIIIIINIISIVITLSYLWRSASSSALVATTSASRAVSCSTQHYLVLYLAQTEQSFFKVVCCSEQFIALVGTDKRLVWPAPG